MKIISLGDDRYLLRGTVSAHTHFSTEELKKQYRADIVLRQGDKFYLCEKIIVAEFD
tara:strand:- start:471 stop:641 length:171 start_codon:yes stop_codon:yes gene_type:complete